MGTTEYRRCRRGQAGGDAEVKNVENFIEPCGANELDLGLGGQREAVEMFGPDGAADVGADEAVARDGRVARGGGHSANQVALETLGLLILRGGGREAGNGGRCGEQDFGRSGRHGR